VCRGSQIEENVIVGRNVYIGVGVQIGSNCKIQNNALIYGPAILEEGVFVGPAVILKYDPLYLTKPSDEDYEKYYINGDKIEFEEWKIYNRQHKLK
jgi:UDP-3-O-[3-hydroxymyristoyl] glucosamine N-acyltransferase